MVAENGHENRKLYKNLWLSIITSLII